MSDPGLGFESEENFFDMNTTYTTNMTVFESVAEQVSSSLLIYYVPFLVVLGIFGNLVSVLVFYTSNLRFQSTSQYLSALAICDTIFLVQLIAPWLATAQINDIFNHEIFCQFFIYISYVTSFLSAWLVVAFTVERFVAVLYPLRRNAIYTIKRARLIICGIATVAIVFNIPLLILAVSKPNDCNIDVAYMDYAATFNVMDTIVSFTMPMLIISVLNICITVGVKRLERARRGLLRVEDLPNWSRTTRVQNRPRSQQKVTRMLVIISTVFVCLNLPAYTMRIIAYAFKLAKASEENTALWGAFQEVALMFFYTNFGINFILYCLTGQNFRQALVQTFTRRTARRGAAVRRPRGRNNSMSTSFVSCTEPTNHRRDEDFISRWTFDNSRQRRPPQEHIEMDTLPTYQLPRYD